MPYIKPEKILIYPEYELLCRSRMLFSHSSYIKMFRRLRGLLHSTKGLNTLDEIKRFIAQYVALEPDREQNLVFAILLKLSRDLRIGSLELWTALLQSYPSMAYKCNDGFMLHAGCLYPDYENETLLSSLLIEVAILQRYYLNNRLGAKAVRMMNVLALCGADPRVIIPARRNSSEGVHFISPAIPLIEFVIGYLPAEAIANLMIRLDNNDVGEIAEYDRVKKYNKQRFDIAKKLWLSAKATERNVCTFLFAAKRRALIEPQVCTWRRAEDIGRPFNPITPLHKFLIRDGDRGLSRKIVQEFLGFPRLEQATLLR